MKKLLFYLLLMGSFAMAQEKCEDVKKENVTLKAINEKLTSENNYLKKVLEINKPILEQEEGGIIFKITKVVGNIENKSIAVTMLMETKDENKKYSFTGSSIIDLEGNEIGIDYFKSDQQSGNLYLDTPKKIKLIFTYKDLEDEFPRIIKLFRFNYTYSLESDSWHEKRIKLEFRDLNVKLK
ncbi:hypothetical protein KRX57_09300 [Weeksellaceae bacterium TAE3-ERU29]|nr:hypothetical protein [Weeksellaceae bacterium TAE3-ERU29]